MVRCSHTATAALYQTLHLHSLAIQQYVHVFVSSDVIFSSFCLFVHNYKKALLEDCAGNIINLADVSCIFNKIHFATETC